MNNELNDKIIMDTKGESKMATVLFVRDGNDPNRAKGYPVSLSTVIDHFAKYERVFSINPPTFGLDTQVTEYFDYRYVVVRIDADEVCPEFCKAGHYIIKDLPVSVAVGTLGLEHLELTHER